MNPLGTVTPRRFIGPLGRLLALLALLTLVGGCERFRSDTLGEIRERGTLRVAMLNSPTTYYLGADGFEGPEYALVERFANELEVTVEVVPVADRAELREAIASRRADLAASQLSWSGHWRGVALPSEVYAESPLFWVYERSQKRPATTADIRKLRAVVLEDSAAWHYLDSRSAITRAGYDVTDVPKDVGRDPLELVATGRADVALIDGREFAATRARYRTLDVAFGLEDRRPLYWMVRKDGRDLLKLVNTFLGRERAAQRIPEPVGEFDPGALPEANAERLAIDLVLRLPELKPLFESAAAETPFDWRLLAALGYQESMWRAEAKSPQGAQGLMMLMPRTARSLGVTDPFDAAQSITAGARYLAKLHETIPSRIREPDRTWMALAAYNMGYGHLEDARVLTAKQGGSPDRWIDVRERLTLLSDEFWYLQAKNGYARGWETRLLVDRVQQYLELIEARFSSELPAVASRAPGTEETRQ